MSLTVTVSGSVTQEPKRFENRAGEITVTFDVLSREEHRNSVTGESQIIVRTFRVRAEDALAQYVLENVPAGTTVTVSSNRLTTDGPGSADATIVVVAREVSLTSAGS